MSNENVNFNFTFSQKNDNNMHSMSIGDTSIFSINKILDIKVSTNDNENEDYVETSFNCLDLFFGKLKTSKLSFLFLLSCDYIERSEEETEQRREKKMDLLKNLFGKKKIEKHAREITDFFKDTRKESFGVYLHLLSDEMENKALGCFELKGLSGFSAALQKKIIFLLTSFSEFILVFEEDIKEYNIIELSGVTLLKDSNKAFENQAEELMNLNQKIAIANLNLKDEFSILPRIIIINGTKPDYSLFKHLNSNLKFDQHDPLSKLEVKSFEDAFLNNCKECFLYFLNINKLSQSSLIKYFGKSTAELLQTHHIEFYNNIQALYTFFNFEKWSIYLEIYDYQIFGTQLFGIIQSNNKTQIIIFFFYYCVFFIIILLQFNFFSFLLFFALRLLRLLE